MKKFISLALALILIYTCSLADTDIEATQSVFEKRGYTVSDIRQVDKGEFNYIDSLKLSKDGEEGYVRYQYAAKGDTAELVAGDIAYVASGKKTRQELISVLSAIINADRNYNKEAFYNISAAFLSYLHDCDAEKANNILKQILAQHEINSYFPDSPMTSYVDNVKGADGFDENADSKNPVLDGKKYFVRINDDGIVLSFRKTDEASTIELADTKQNTQKMYTINKQYAWDNMVSCIEGILGKGFVLEQEPQKINMPMNHIEDNKVRLVCTGTGVMLSQSQAYRVYRLADSNIASMPQVLKGIVNNFNTLNSYAIMADTDGIELIVYLENGQNIYKSGNITDLSDLLTKSLGTPVLLQEDKSVSATEENLADAVNKDAPSVIEIKQTADETIEPASNESVQVKEPAEKDSVKGKQIEIKKRLVNIRETPGGKVIFRLKRGRVAEVISDVQKLKGYKWYNIRIDGNEGWARGDTVKILDYYVAPTPQPSTDDSDIDINTNAYKFLSRGSKGEAVKKLQARLVELGYSKSEPDGKYGGKTEVAVKKAQKAFNMQMNGKADVAFQSKLFSNKAITATDADMHNAKPDSMTLATDTLVKAEKNMKNLYTKELNGYKTGVALNTVQNNWSLVANAVDKASSNYEISLSYNDAKGAANVNPKLMIKVLNLYIQNIQKVELVRGDKVQELDRSLWTQDGGMVMFDITNNKTAIKQIMDKRITTNIRFSNDTESFTISMDAKGGPYLITKYMLQLWKKLGAQAVADAAAWQNAQ